MVKWFFRARFELTYGYRTVRLIPAHEYKSFGKFKKLESLERSFSLWFSSLYLEIVSQVV